MVHARNLEGHVRIWVWSTRAPMKRATMGTASRHTTAFKHDGRSLEDWCIAKAEDGTWYHRRTTWPGYVHGEASAKGDVLLEDVFATMRETLRGAQESLYLQTLVRLEEWFDQFRSSAQLELANRDPLHRLRKQKCHGGTTRINS